VRRRPIDVLDLEVGGQPAVSHFNNVFVNNTLAVDTETNEVIENGSNALFGNTTNYAGSQRMAPVM